MIGTPESPLAVPHDGVQEKVVVPTVPQDEAVTPLQVVSNTPAPQWPEGTLLVIDRDKGGTKPLAPGEDPSRAVAKVVNGVVVPLAQLDTQNKAPATVGRFKKLLNSIFGKKAA